jgi:serine phosphatase RsbU (regulator of sigma subunit)
MSAPYRLPPAGTPGPRLPRRVLSSRGVWVGLVALAAEGASRLGIVPAGLVLVTRAALVALVLFAGWRGVSWLLRALFWRIRTKLIVSYLFIAVVPLVLLATFFLTGGFICTGLVANYMVAAELQATAERIRAAAEAALGGDSPETSVAALETEYPGLSWVLTSEGRVLASSGPARAPGPDESAYAGLVGRRAEALRVVCERGAIRLAIEVPFDRRLQDAVRERTGVRVVADFPDLSGSDPPPDAERSRGGGLWDRSWDWPALADSRDTESGDVVLAPLLIRFRPAAVLRRLSPASLNVTDVLLGQALLAVGGLFLVVYLGALMLGWLLARSITKSVHALSTGTERLRQGDFSHRIQVGSRDQLGDLADSFNMMGRGIEDLLRQRAEKERLEEELRIARQIQMSLLPRGDVDLPGVQVAAACLPAAEVGGDYYDILRLGETRLGVLVADVSGKGTSAALYMAELKGLVLSLARIFDSPRRLLCEANRILAGTIDSRSFITMTYAVLDLKEKRLRFARAGHSPLVRAPEGGEATALTPPGLGLGIDAGEQFDRLLEERELAVAAGDVFLFFTDGLTEAMDENGDLFGESRVRSLLAGHGASTSEDLKQRIMESVHGFVGDAPQHDDMTLVVLKVE